MRSNEPSTRFVVLYVCSGNICRSPLAQQVLQARLAGWGDSVEVLSAGTVAVAGHAMTDEAAELSLRYGGDPSGHRSTPLTTDHIVAADLVLTATRDHRGAVVSAVPRASRYTFTMKQFARLLGSLSEEDIRSAATTGRGLVATAAAQRGFAPPPETPELDDVGDPYLEPFAVYEDVAAQIEATLEPLVAALELARAGRPT
jgi:protein-tyrosine phosphatase